MTGLPCCCVSTSSSSSSVPSSSSSSNPSSSSSSSVPSSSSISSSSSSSSSIPSSSSSSLPSSSIPSSSNPSSSNPSSSNPSSSNPSSSNPSGSSSSYSGCCCEYYFEVDRNGPTPPHEADIQLLSSTPYKPGTPNTGCLDPAWETGCPEWDGLAAFIEDMALHISDPKYDFHGAYGFLSVDVCNGVIVQINS